MGPGLNYYGSQWLPNLQSGIGTRGPTHARQEDAIPRKLGKPVRHQVRLTDRHHETIDPVTHPLGDAAGDIGDGGDDAGSHGLEHRDARSFIPAHEHAHVNAAEETLDPRGAASSVNDDAAMVETPVIE